MKIKERLNQSMKNRCNYIAVMRCCSGYMMREIFHQQLVKRLVGEIAHFATFLDGVKEHFSFFLIKRSKELKPLIIFSFLMKIASNNQLIIAS